MSAAPTLELFVCVPQQGARLTRHACAKRHEASTGGPRKARNGGMELALLAYACEGCAIGAAHAKGQTPERWPDGSPIVVISTSTPAAPSASKRQEPQRPVVTAPRPEELSCRRRIPPTADVKAAPRVSVRKPPRSLAGGALGRPIAFGDRTRTLAAWAREADVIALGITEGALRQRIDSGWSIGDALTTARGNPNPQRGTINVAPKAPRACERCGGIYQPTSARQKRCAPCAPLHFNEQRRKQRAARRAAAAGLCALDMAEAAE